MLEKLQKNDFIIGGSDKIFMLDIPSSIYQALESEDLGKIKCICVLKDWRILLGNARGEIVNYDFDSNQILSIQLMHSNAVSAIVETEDNIIFSSSYDKTVNVYT